MADIYLSPAESWDILECGLRSIYGNKFDGATITVAGTDPFKIRVVFPDIRDDRRSSVVLSKAPLTPDKYKRRMDIPDSFSESVKEENE